MNMDRDFSLQVLTASRSYYYQRDKILEEISFLKSALRDTKKEYEELKKKGSLIYRIMWSLVRGFGFVYLFAMVFGIIAAIILFKMSELSIVDEQQIVPMGCTIAMAISILVSTFLTIRSDKKTKKKNAEKLAALESLIQSYEEDLKKEREKYQAFEKKNDGVVLDLLPPDYRDADIINKLIYFLENGHAATMQEAVREYDTYAHHKKMEEEAFLLTQTAMQAEKNTQQAAKAAQEAAMWANYSAYVNSKK